MSRCFTWFPIWWLQENFGLYQNLEYFTRIGDFTWMVVWLWRISGSYSQELWWLVF